jgi:hypothetical protein
MSEFYDPVDRGQWKMREAFLNFLRRRAEVRVYHDGVRFDTGSFDRRPTATPTINTLDQVAICPVEFDVHANYYPPVRPLRYYGFGR